MPEGLWTKDLNYIWDKLLKVYWYSLELSSRKGGETRNKWAEYSPGWQKMEEDSRQWEEKHQQKKELIASGNYK